MVTRKTGKHTTQVENTQSAEKILLAKVREEILEPNYHKSFPTIEENDEAYSKIVAIKNFARSHIDHEVMTKDPEFTHLDPTRFKISLAEQETILDKAFKNSPEQCHKIKQHIKELADTTLAEVFARRESEKLLAQTMAMQDETTQPVHGKHTQTIKNKSRAGNEITL